LFEIEKIHQLLTKGLDINYGIGIIRLGLLEQDTRHQAIEVK
jgi:hypothetical protein